MQKSFSAAIEITGSSGLRFRRAMQAHQRLVSLSTYTNVVILLLLPLVDSTEEEYANNRSSTHEASLKPLFEIKLHAFFLWVSMGFLMPIGILAIRMSHREEHQTRLKTLFYVHSTSQILSVILITAGAVMSIKNFNNSFSNHHQRIGVSLYGMVWLQALIGFLRPQRGSNGRSVWFFVHWIIGTMVSLHGIISIYRGLQAYHEKTSRSIHTWTTVFITEVSVIIFVYLFQDKWMYIQKQGDILGDEPIRPTNSHRDKKNELATGSC